MEDAKTTFGRRLRFVRKAQGLTLEELGKTADIGFKHIAQIERAEKAPSFDAIDRLAKALKVSPYELFLPYEADGPALDQAMKQLSQAVNAGASPALKRLLLATLPLLRQFETDSIK